jgi:hypothetical protein
MGMMMVAQSSIAGKEYGQSKDISFSPFSRVATMSAVQDINGDFDQAATAAKAKAAGQALGYYLATVDETGDPNFPGGNCILGGYDGIPENSEEVAEAILGIPTPVPYAQKVNVLDLCNKSYASMALGVAPIIGGDTPLDPTDDKFVVNGYSHTPTLPCEVAIYYDDENIYVDMLDPSAIFKLFFSDVIFSDEMKDDEFAAAIQAMPVQVKKELKSIIYSALTPFEAEYNAKLVEMDERMGPAYESLGDIIRTVQQSPQQSPYKHVSYTKEDGNPFTPAESSLVAQTIINTMTIHGTEAVTDDEGNFIYPTPGYHEDDLEDELTDGSLWRSARPTALGLPGPKNLDGITMKNFVIEACSPFFAKQALSTGAHHATALPCEITVQIIDNDGDGLTETLVVSYLDAHFMFGALFSDMSKEEMDAFAEVPTDVMDDLEAIVEYSLANDLVNSEGEPIVLNPATQIKYNMLPVKGKKHDHHDDHDHDDHDDGDDGDDD